MEADHRREWREDGLTAAAVPSSNDDEEIGVHRLLAQVCRNRRDRLLPYGLEARRAALQTIINYALQQSLIPRKIDVEESCNATTGGAPSRPIAPCRCASFPFVVKGMN
jgi:hypothetical protein